MALTLQAAVLAKRRALNFQYLKPETRRSVKILFEQLASRGNPDLQIVEFDNLAAQDTVLADVACRLYGLVLSKVTATAAYFKASDHATTVSPTAPEIELEQNAANQEVFMSFPFGYAQANGITVTSHTTSDGAIESSAGDGAQGFAIIGGA